ncbi:MAG: isoprenylcysteine carboxylmethyltransferase family protein [Verrucomicrobia bacterium]|nr:isoprenylcysteine carboxylmethyltransferase family protein [Verrucomicrobiota bacterium]
MKPDREDFRRGSGWVIAQFAIMFALLAAGPVWPGDWTAAWSWPAGSVLLILGAWLGIRGERDLGKHRTPYPRPKPDCQLITSGIYGFIRHPLYAAVITLGFAWALLWRSEPALVLAALQIPFFDAKARREERWLLERFTAYADYTRRVKRFIPGIY